MFQKHDFWRGTHELKKNDQSWKAGLGGEDIAFFLNACKLM